MSLRADARTNRDHLVVAARALFSTRGIDVPLEEVARHAGVGKATLYRRFPHRDQLIEAVTFDIYHQLLSLLADAVAAEPDAWSALRRFMHDWTDVRLGLIYTGICEQLPALIQANDELRAARAEFFDRLDQLVESAQEEGSMRTDLGAGDLALFANLLVRQPDVPAPDGVSTVSRMLELVLDGLRVRPGQRLPGTPRRMADLDVTTHVSTS